MNILTTSTNQAKNVSLEQVLCATGIKLEELSDEQSSLVVGGHGSGGWIGYAAAEHGGGGWIGHAVEEHGGGGWIGLQ